MVISDIDYQDYLHASLSSIANQTCQPEQVLLVYNGFISPSIKELVISFKTLLPIYTVSLHCKSSFGYCLCQAIPFITTDYICRHDPDDIMIPSRIFNQIQYLSFNSEIDLVGSSCYLLGPDPSRTREFIVKPSSKIHSTLWRNPFIHSAIMFKTSIFSGSVSYSWLSRAQDLELWFRLASRNVIMANIPQPLIYYRLPIDKKKYSFPSVLYQYMLITHLILKYQTNFIGLIMYVPVLFKPFIPQILWQRLTK